MGDMVVLLMVAPSKIKMELLLLVSVVLFSKHSLVTSPGRAKISVTQILPLSQAQPSHSHAHSLIFLALINLPHQMASRVDVEENVITQVVFANVSPDMLVITVTLSLLLFKSYNCLLRHIKVGSEV